MGRVALLGLWRLHGAPLTRFTGEVVVANIHRGLWRGESSASQGGLRVSHCWGSHRQLQLRHGLMRCVPLVTIEAAEGALGGPMPRVATVVVTVVTCDRAVVTLGSSSLTGHAGWVGEEEGVVNLLEVLTLLRGWLPRRLPSTRHGRRRLLLRLPIGTSRRLLLLRLSLRWLPLRLCGLKGLG